MPEDDVVPLIEPVPIAPVFITGIGQAVRMNGNVQLVLYVDHIPVIDTQTAARIVVARLIMPSEAIALMVQHLRAAARPRGQRPRTDGG